MTLTCQDQREVAEICKLTYSHLTRTLADALGTQVFCTVESDSEGVRLVRHVDDILEFGPAHRWIVALADVDTAEHDHGIDSTQARAARYVLDMLRKQQ
jgi:hypothetical protein